jgi:protein phosphatase
VGSPEKLILDLIRGQVFVGDLFLICSDGLTDMVDDSHIQQILSSNIDLWEKNEELINLAKDAGGLDNITVALAEIVQL